MSKKKQSNRNKQNNNAKARINNNADNGNVLQESTDNTINNDQNLQKSADKAADGSSFKPYIPADRITPEFTATSVIMGVLLAIIFGAANAYLGLRVGMTVSASIPAAVISMGVIRVIMRKDSVLESNIVQTVGSAGESLAAGAIFTMPVLFLWAKEGITDTPSLVTISLIALCGGVLGVLFMVPLRNALIVKEHGVLPYPEGTACAEVLLAGEEGGASAKTVFVGMGLAALFKFLVDGLKIIPGVITTPIKALKTELSAEVYPALIGVGYICGAKISSYMFAGGILGWFVLIPAIVTFGGDTVLYPGTDTIANMYAAGGAGAIWGSYIRYIGAGMVAAGGIISLIKSLPLIVTTFVEAIKGMKGGTGNGSRRTEQDIDMRFVGIGVIAIALLIWILPMIPVSLLGAFLIVIFGFFFGAVSSRMVGLVGSSNNPVSGMAIATLLFATLCLKATGDTGAHGMVGAISIGSIICIVAAMAGDTSQDLKTGYILGATPKKQQIGELIGAVISAFTIGGVLVLLDSAWGFGTKDLAAPQATLMKMIVEGVMDGNLPWSLVFIGIFIAVVVEILGIPVLPVAIGLYLPLELSSTIMIGGVIRYLADRKSEQSEAGAGVLFCSGMIAGEGLVGILLAILAVLKVADKMDLSGVVNTGTIGGIILMALMILAVVKFADGGKKNEA
ncbi:MAG: oligopeptide transporter, OPT family [Lachnospiraceae bacterium]|nr:oligopeptide transporter, OPT family [Lachnospiraceae bacterium]